MLTDSLIFFYFFIFCQTLDLAQMSEEKKMIGLQLCLAERWQLSIVPPLRDVLPQARG